MSCIRSLGYLRIESAPQGFIWVNTYPTSDKGEPHTQEHLLLGKGDRGRKQCHLLYRCVRASPPADDR